MSSGIQVRFDAIREIDFSAISGSYASVGTATTETGRLIGFNNSMDEDLYISFDGTTDNLRIQKNSFKLYDLTTNRWRDDGLFLSIGTQISVKEVSSSPSSGSFWIEMFYTS